MYAEAWIASATEMDTHGWVAIATLVVAVTLFISEAIPLAFTALSIPVVLAATGTIDPPADALRGFGNHAVIALAAIFVLGAGLKESGVATLMARGLEHVGGRSYTRLVVIIMVAVAVLSAFMSNAATVAVFLPAVAVLSRRALVPPSKLMMPLAFAAILGGILTVIGTTPNLILATDLDGRPGGSLGMFDFALIGAPVVAVGILYMATLGRRLLPEYTGEDRLKQAQLPEEVARNYGFAANLYRMKVVENSKIVGKSIREARIGEKYHLDVVLVFRPGNIRQRYLHPKADLVFEVDDELYLEGEMEHGWHFAEEEFVQFGIAGPRSLERILGRGVVLAEVSLPPRSDAIGKTFRDLDFRQRHGLNVISIWRRNEAITSGTADIQLELGDAFLVSGSAGRVRALAEDPDYLVLTDQSQTEDVRLAPVAIALMFVALVPPLFGWVPLALSAMASALLMWATGCVSLETAKRSIDFRILFLIIGTIPLGIALEQHGVAQLAADAIRQVQPLLGSPGILAGLFLIAAVLSTTSNNGAAAVILAPVAAKVAADSGIPITRAFLAVAYGTSCAFMLPFAHQCNLMVMGPGGYTTRDFARVGLGMSIVMAASTIFFLSVL
ncbi:MAG: SLC13 family permease [Planctomycetota bacterium]|jgi:di/tricarboxylate transporter